SEGIEFEYESEHYGLPVTTKQEVPIQFYVADEIEKTESGYRVTHEPFEQSGDVVAEDPT
ncbi:MAG: site-specific DNA-methyltransferase, partial [Halobacteriota archaeon]